MIIKGDYMINKSYNEQQSNKGETLIEMIISLAIFALLVNLIATVMTTSNNIEAASFENRNTMNNELKVINDCNMIEDVTDELELGEIRSVTCTVNGAKAGQFKYRTIKSEHGIFLKLLYCASRIL